MPGRPRAASYEAAPNIALIKYWGVRDEALRLPWNTSVSVTLDRLRTRTSVRFVRGLERDRFVLNGVEASGALLEATVRFLDRVRALAGITEHAWVRSHNNFPTASGLASSASGFAALAGAASRAAGLSLSPAEISRLARFGSGSASRSIFGGFVEWRAGRLPDGSDCEAVPLAPEDHWPDLVDLVVVIADAPEKAVRSAVAMQRSVATSPLFGDRQKLLPARIERVRRAILARDAPRLFQAMMEECDEFRAVCESTDPPLDYLVPASRRVLEVVRALNARAPEPLVGYTHDAGAHLHLFVREADLRRLRHALGPVAGIRRLWSVRPGPGGRYRTGRGDGADSVA